MTNTKFGCVPCVVGFYPVYTACQALDSVDTVFVRRRACRTGTAAVTEVRRGSAPNFFSASSQYRNVTHSSAFARMPPCCWERWVWQLLLRLSNSSGFCLFSWKERHTAVGILPQMRWKQFHLLTTHQVSKQKQLFLLGA